LYLAPYFVGFVYHRHVIPIMWAFVVWGTAEVVRLKFGQREISFQQRGMTTARA